MLRTTLALTALLLLAACTAQPDGHADHTHPAASPSGSASQAPSGGFSDTDVAYVQLAIPQDETALPVLELAKTREGVDPALVALVTEVETGHHDELDKLREALSDAGQTYLNLHDGHDMPGMVTADELDKLAKATGQAFDDQLRTLLRAHFEESTTVAKSELAAGSSPEVLEVTRNIETSRASYLTKLGT
ncbi:DUF305 domain-containing protein [Umezawaea sp. Da 62-37]|uniref:DUF305 domain-containing protein n=1 Tax=Umezawaea sp. Da 62-37 TaxID=3075927 RepID=UPI0028F6EF46|nr:DUF305 domain-containing protein [Umezawaea sp. Da 62-37]WNV84134.1 DUF305 domain-containing protein [Umezawaea sp. Da 62-37]